MDEDILCPCLVCGWETSPVVWFYTDGSECVVFVCGHCPRKLVN